MIDRRTPGGCPDCNAYQTLEQAPSGVFVLVIHHDDTCPTLAAFQGWRNA